MFIKLPLICLLFAPLIIIDKVTGIPVKSPTHVGKLLRWLTGVDNDLASRKIFEKQWTLTFIRGPLLAQVELNRYIDFRDWQKQHSNAPIETNVLLQSDLTSITSNDLDPSNATSISDDATTTFPLESTAETTQEAPSTFELKDNDETTVEPDVEVNRVKREASFAFKVDGETEPTTIESSTTANQIIPVASTHQNFYYIPSSFPYPPSKNPSAEFVSITQSPNRKRTSVKSYNDFLPSQVDYGYKSNFNPAYCTVNFDHHRINYGDAGGFYYHKWK